MKFIQNIVDEVEAFRSRKSNQQRVEAALTQKLIQLDSLKLSGEFKDVNYQCRKEAVSFIKSLSTSSR